MSAKQKMSVDDQDVERKEFGRKNNARHHKRKSWGDLSYTTRVSVSFVLISLMTILVAFGVLTLAWEQHFQEYTQSNMERLADSTASAVAERYAINNGNWTTDAISPAASTASLNKNVGIQLVSSDGIIRYDSSPTAVTGSPSLAPSSKRRSVTSDVLVNGETVATVSLWVYGSDTLLTQADRDFRNQSYSAMGIAMGMAVLIALIAGVFFARNLVEPINRMTRTARAIKEGDLAARTQLSGDDEVSRLGETFDQMADAIEKDRLMERRLTTDVAHELRTPLMAIQSTVEAMVDGVFEADEERLGTIDAEVQRLSRLVDALLKLSRLENRKIPMNKQKLNLGDLLEGIIATHEAYVRDSGLNLIFEKEDDVYVFGDPDMLRQATANLISNAVRYTPEGSITVRVAKGDIMASIAVQDTGIGLTPEEAKMVFSRFWRADAGRNRAQGGLGIGLSVVKEIVDRHNGWVRVEGKKDAGAKFTIFIPLYDEARIKNHEREKNRLRKERDKAETGDNLLNRRSKARKDKKTEREETVASKEEAREEAATANPDNADERDDGAQAPQR